MIGVEREIELGPAFQELAHLFPQLDIQLIMIGREVAPNLGLRSMTCNNIHITQLRGVYHQLQLKNEIPIPDLVLGCNAGLAAYLTWAPTLQHLASTMPHVPVYFTDYCRYSCELSSVVVNRLDIGHISNITMNPFCSPLRHFCDQNRFACFSNAFFFYLMYKKI